LEGRTTRVRHGVELFPQGQDNVIAGATREAAAQVGKLRLSGASHLISSVSSVAVDSEGVELSFNVNLWLVLAQGPRLWCLRRGRVYGPRLWAASMRVLAQGPRLYITHYTDTSEEGRLA
jgi:hypothetical protein